MAEDRHVRKGFGLRTEVRKELHGIYASQLVELLKADGYRLEFAGGLSIRLAREFGFCYGVDRAVEYAYESRRKFPDRRIYLTGEIIHNPHVNDRLRALGVEFLTGPGAVAGGFDGVLPTDVVIIPAFGLPVWDLERLFQLGCTLVDTTCGSVLNVWKNVERYGREKFTAVIHGKHDHEETIATASRTSTVGGRFIVVRDLAEAEVLARFIEGNSTAKTLLQSLAHSASPDFDPDRDLQRVGLANQTTMLSTESLAIQERLRQAMRTRHGDGGLAERFRAFDTICSATQDRQDAVVAMCAEGVDLMLVIGGYNSSNTGHLLEIASRATTAYHIEDASSLVTAAEIRHKPHGAEVVVEQVEWLPTGPLRLGVTSGASTPNNRVGEVIAQVLELRGVEPAEIDRRIEATTAGVATFRPDL